jgi:hypothetical protein
MTEPWRDDTMADLLARVPVPAATERFWADLDARLAPLDPAHPRQPPAAAPHPSDRGPALPAPVARLVPRPPEHPPSRWPWRVLTVAAAAVLVGLVVVTRGPAADRIGGAGGTLSASASADEVVATYVEAWRRGDEATARALLGPRARAEVDNGGKLPRSGGPDLPNRRYVATMLSDQEAVVLIRSGGFVTNRETGVTTEVADQPYLGAVVVWRASTTERWLVEGSQIGLDVEPKARGQGAGGLESGNGVKTSMSIPEAGRSWLVVDGVVHATATWTEPAHWDVPVVPPTGTNAGREVVDVFIGPRVISASGIRFGRSPSE